MHRWLTHSESDLACENPDSSVVISAGTAYNRTHPDPVVTREKQNNPTGYRIVQKLALLLLMFLQSLYLGCIDPYFYTDQEEVALNHHPAINEEEVIPQASTQPVEVNIGDNCQREPFRIGSIYDPDLELEFIYRWHMTVSIGGNESQPTLVSENTITNDPDSPSETVTGPSLEIDFDRLNAAFFNDVPDLVGKIHKLEFHVTDDRFLPGSFFDVSEDAGSDSIYWLIRIEEDDC